MLPNFQNVAQFPKFCPIFPNFAQFSKCCPIFKCLPKGFPIFKMLPNFQNFDRCPKFCPISKILPDFQNVTQFSKILPNFQKFAQISPNFQNFARFSKCYPIFKILHNFLLGDGVDLLGDGVNLLGDGGDPRSIAGGSSKMTVAQKCPGAMEITKNCKEPGGVQLCTVEVCKIKIDALQKKSLYCVKQCTKGHSVQHQGHQKQ